MKIFLMLLMSSLFIIQPAQAGFDDFLKDVLVETSNQAIGANTNQYSFVPGEVVIKKDAYVVYYSGYEFDGNVKTLLLSMMTSGGVVLLKYPNPQEIQVNSYRLQVLKFDNLTLDLRILNQQKN